MYGLLHPNRIAWKLIKMLVVFSSLVTLVTTGVQLWSEYGRDIDAIQSRFVQVERSYLDSIAENVWESDTGRLDLLVNGIIEFPDFKSAMVRDENGQTLASVGYLEDQRSIRKTYPLHYTFRGKNLKIGELDVVASLTEVYGRALDRVGLILVSNAIKTFLVAVFMFGMVYWLLTRHLDVMAKFAQDMDFALPNDPLQLERGFLSRQRDEMDQLADSLNYMQIKLFRSYEDLRVLNDELEDRVRDRTKALSDEVEVRKLTERKLSQSEERLRDIAEAGSDWMWEMGPDLRFTYMSGSTIADGAVSREEVVGRYRPDDPTDSEAEQETWRAHMDDLENHRPFRNFEYKLKKPDGSDLFVRVSGKPVFDENGAFQGYRGISSNITVEVEASQRFTKAEQDLRVLSSVVEQNPSMVFITDHNGQIQYVNEKFIEVTGYTAADVVGRNPRVLKSIDTSHAVHEKIWENLLAGLEWRGEIKDIRKDGTAFWAYATIAPVKNEDGDITHFVAIHEDISDRKATEVHLRTVPE